MTQSRDLQQATNRTFKLTGMTREQVLATMKDIGKTFAETLVKQDIPIKSERVRPDVGPVQVDMGVIRDKVSKPEPVIVLKFDVQGNMGVQLNIRLMDFLANPEAFTQDLLSRLAPMRRNVERLRANKRAINDAMYKAMTEGGSNG